MSETRKFQIRVSKDRIHTTRSSVFQFKKMLLPVSAFCHLVAQQVVTVEDQQKDLNNAILQGLHCFAKCF